MRTTMNLDEALLDEAQRLTGIAERTMLVHEGLRALIERESARRLAKLGGSEKARSTGRLPASLSISTPEPAREAVVA